MPVESILSRYFPEISSLRDGQSEAIRRAAAGESLVYVAPTGSGKSLVYQAAGLQRGGITLVLSPLKALIRQQVERLVSRGIPAIELHSGQPGERQYEQLRRVATGSFRGGFLFISPERAFADGMLEFALRRRAADIRLVVVDEAHCISQWGHSFRPSYKAIPDFLRRIFGEGRPPVLCLTATLSARDCAEIRADFKIPATGLLSAGEVLRPNLSLAVEQHDDEPAKLERLKRLLSEPGAGKTLVYVHRKYGRWGTRNLTEELQIAGIDCEYFDADRDDAAKGRVLAGFESGAIQTVLATSAFGMGIDIPDIRRVIHYLMPESAEQYHQEVGRAGRDGEPAQCLLLWTPVNLTVRADQIRESCPSAELVQKVYDDLSLGPEPQGFPSYEALPDDSRELMVFHRLIAEGVVRVAGRAFGRVGDFAPARRKHCPRAAHLLAVPPPGLLAQEACRRGVSIDALRDELYTAYTEERLRLRNAPNKCLYLCAGDPLDDQRMSSILGYFRCAVESRLGDFHRFASAVKDGHPARELPGGSNSAIAPGDRSRDALASSIPAASGAWAEGSVGAAVP